MNKCTHCEAPVHARGLCSKHYMADLLAENPEYKARQLKSSRTWKAKNRPKTQASQMNRRARAKKIKGRVTEAHLKHLIKSTTHCIYCATPLNRANSEFDHVVPLMAGGSNENDNIQLICKRCNRAKGEGTEAMYIQWLEQIARRLGLDKP